jgi:hypothetical protein
MQVPTDPGCCGNSQSIDNPIQRTPKIIESGERRATGPSPNRNIPNANAELQMF